MSKDSEFRGFGVPPVGTPIRMDTPEERMQAPEAEVARGKYVRRDQILNGEIYARDGVTYFAHGKPGDFLGIVCDTGRLVSGIDPTLTVERGNKWDIITNPHDGGGRVCARSDVRFGELFRTKNGEKLYGNLGRMYDGRYAAINMDNPTANDFVESSSPDKQVVVVGGFRMVPA